MTYWNYWTKSRQYCDFWYIRYKKVSIYELFVQLSKKIVCQYFDFCLFVFTKNIFCYLFGKFKFLNSNQKLKFKDYILHTFYNKAIEIIITASDIINELMNCKQF